jgi:flavin reductase (DIM6/NTAB) family NADH-FMN oxidoreductase RutF
MTTPSFDSRAFRRACGQFLTGVTIATTRDALDGPVGVTVNSFCSVSLDPPMVMVCLDKRLGSYQAFCSNANLAIHVLPTDSAHLSTRFARRGADKFGGLAWRNGRANMPVLSEYLALF